ncbi:MAG: AI-2E family transporter [Rhodobacteraceae bacterium]|nr:AI-2E family transporter [Paracoccaceae bacterium]
MQSVFLGIIAFAVVLFLLVQARFILISLAAAIILFSLTADAITAVGRLRMFGARIPAWLASVVALLLIAAGLTTLSAVLLGQANTVLATALSYTDRSAQAIASLFSWLGADVEAAILQSMRSIEIGSYLTTVASQAGSLLSATVLVILFVGFLFAERIWFRDKLRHLYGDPERADRVGVIIGTIMRRVNRYLMVKALVSGVTGIIVYAIARVSGLDLAVAMAILTFVLNFIPSIGSIVATAMVALIALVQTNDPVLASVLFFAIGIVQFTIGNVIDPMLMGHALRLSSFGIIMSLAFWGAVWGLPGMFLAVPIMVATMIACSNIPMLRPLAVLLSREGLPEVDTGAPSAAAPPQG